MKPNRKLTNRAGFTILEVMVSISILSILFLLLFVPLLTSMNLMSQGQGDAHVQNTLRSVLVRIERELGSALIVYPNDGGSTTLTSGLPMTGATVLPVRNGNVFRIGQFVRVGANNADSNSPRQVLWVTPTRVGLANPTQAVHPYGSVVVGLGPYFDAVDADSGTPCGSVRLVNSLSRLDFQLPARLLSGGLPRLLFPLEPEPQWVTYYVRRRDLTQPYEERDNPLVLYRAQFVPPPAGVDPCHDTPGNNQDGWLRDTVDLESVSLNQTVPIGLHTALTPEDANVIARTIVDPLVGLARLVSDTTFQAEDTDSDGRVDQVNINLVLGRYDAPRREVVSDTLRSTVVIRNSR